MLRRSARWCLTLLAVAGLPASSACQIVAQRPPSIPLELVAAELVRFERPIRLGVGERAIEYREALVLSIEVSRATMDSLPPSLAPYLYVGLSEFSVFGSRLREGADRLILTFHVRDWNALADNAPLVLTVDRGAPRRNAERFQTLDVPRFQRALVVDRRRRFD